MVKTFKHLHDKDVRARDMMYTAPQRKAAFQRDAHSGLNSSAHLIHAVHVESIMVLHCGGDPSLTTSGLPLHAD